MGAVMGLAYIIGYIFGSIIGLGVAAILGIIPSNIAKKKGYSAGLFWLFGFGCLPAAIVVACVLPNKNNRVNDHEI